MSNSIITKLTYHISKMDCPSEEMMIRQVLATINERLIFPLQFDFDLAGRRLSLYYLTADAKNVDNNNNNNSHDSMVENIEQKLHSLKLNTSYESCHYFVKYHIHKMDCPSEQTMIQTALSGFKSIIDLDFELAERTLVVEFTTDNISKNEPQQTLSETHQAISQCLDNLKLGSKPHLFDETAVANLASKSNNIEQSSCCSGGCSSNSTVRTEEQKQANQRRLLWQVLSINAVFFVIEMSTGLISDSMGLVADSLDMLADSSVYAMSLLAVGATALRQKAVAKLAGWLQIILAMLGLVEVVRRFMGLETMPDFGMMIGVSLGALIANGLCLYLLNKSQSDSSQQQAHMQASQIFTSNDVIINLGIIVSACLVWLLDSPLPDLLIGYLVFVLVLSGARRILQLAK